MALPTPNAIGEIAMAASNGKVALVNSTWALNRRKSKYMNQSLILLVMATANAFEGTAAAPALQIPLQQLEKPF
jgi:hypothetical protein